MWKFFYNKMHIDNFTSPHLVNICLKRKQLLRTMMLTTVLNEWKIYICDNPVKLNLKETQTFKAY